MVIARILLKKQIYLYAKQLLLLGAAFIYLSSCAIQVAPTGGPVDKIPPRILEVVPPINATLVPLDQTVEIAFSEAMDRKSLNRAIFITPNPGERVKYKWKKHKLFIEFLDSLKTNRTYVITLGTDLKDAHGNSLKESYTLAFSTGAELSNGQISGRVYSKNRVQGVLIWAYILEEGQDPDPTKKSGDYITQTDAQGRFKLTNLSEGIYRIFAIQDKDNNRFFEVGSEELGVPFRDVRLTRTQLNASNLNFKITLQDTIGPALVSVSPQDRFHLNLRFDEILHKTGIDILTNYRIQVKGSVSGDSLGISLAYLNDLDPMQVNLITEPQHPKTEYEIEVNNLMDLSRNIIDINFNKATFLGSALSDTIEPKLLLIAPKDSAQSVILSSTVNFHFSEAMDENSFEKSFQLKNSLGPIVSGSFNWETPAFVKFLPDERLESLNSYVISVKLDSIFDLFRNSVADSTYYLTFTTLNMDTLSSISGTIMDEDSTAQGSIYLRVKQTGKDGQSYEIQLDKAGVYEFSDILPGTYVIEGFRDRDKNGEYSFGKAVPFQPSERFFVYSDSIKVRSRWPNEGNDIVITK